MRLQVMGNVEMSYVDKLQPKERGDVYNRQVQDIGAAPHAEHQKADDGEIRLAAQLPQPVFFVQLPNQHQHHLAQ